MLALYKQLTNSFTDQEQCSICEHYKPVTRVSGNNGQHFDNLEDYSTRWRWNVFASRRWWRQVCPDCARLFNIQQDEL